MGFDVERLRKESVTQGAATAEARLAGLPGRGTLQVWRGQNNDVIDILGTWRREVADEEVSVIREALRNEPPVVYEGVVDDPARPDGQEVRTEVIVSSIGSYRLEADEENSYCFVNFAPRNPEEIAS
jgi:hypothetical protein